MKTLSQKIMALAIMLLSVTLSAYADTWTDPETGITWTYTVLNDGTVALGGGTSSTPAVPTTTSGELTVPTQINGIDVTSVMAYGFYNCSKITNIIFEPESITLQKDASYMFYKCWALENINFAENWNTSETTDISNMFNGLGNSAQFMKLSSLEPLRNWNTSKVTNMAGMFKSCRQLTTLEPLKNWDISNVTNMDSLFCHCTKIKSLEPLRNWNTSKVNSLIMTFGSPLNFYFMSIESLGPITNWNISNVSSLAHTFQNCYKITSIEPLKNWDTSKVCNLNSTFQKCLNLTSLEPLKNWNTSKVTSMRSLFYCDSLITSLEPLRKWNTSNVTDMNSLFNGCTGITSLDPLRNWDTSKVTDMYGVFGVLNKILTIEPIQNWNTSNVTDMSYLFTHCRNITSLEPLKNWDTSNVTKLNGIFTNDNNITSLEPLKNWDTSKVTSMSSMFNGCTGITSLEPLRNWDVSNNTSLETAFSRCNITSLEPLRNWNISKVKSLDLTFSGCSGITSVEPLSNWNTGRVTNMDGLFKSTSISTLEPIGNWNTSKVTSMRFMFLNCHNLTYANEINNWDISNVKDMREMFAFSGLKYINMSSWDVTGKWLDNMFAHEYTPGFMIYGEDVYDTNTNSRLERVYLPKKGLVKVQENMFKKCTSLKEITLPSTVTTIDYHAFEGCSSLKEITIPSKVTSINSTAFRNCSSLTEVYCMPTIPPTFTNKYQSAFDESNTTPRTINKTLYVKTSALEAYKANPLWSRFATITDMIPIVIGSTKNYSTLSFDFDADFSETEGVQPYIANKYLEGEEALDYISGFSEAKKRMSPALKKAADSGNTDVKLIVLARYPDGYVPSRTGEDNFDFHGVILYGKPGTYYFKMGEQDFASDNPKTVTWNTNYMKSAYESWLLNPTYDHEPVNWMEYPKEDTYNFVLKNNVFKYIDNAGTINRHKSWLELPAEKVSGSYFEAGAKMISTFDPDEFDPNATGLSFIVEDEPTETQDRYNLNGQKVDANYKGIVISNGRKVLNQ